MTEHVLKTWPSYFQAVADLEKTFEVRWDDRGFQAGDVVLLREWDPELCCECRDVAKSHLDDCARYTGRQLMARIGYVMASTVRRGPRPGFNGDGYVVFSLCDPILLEETEREVVDVELPETAPSAAEAAQIIASASGLGDAVSHAAKRPEDRFTVR